MFIGSEMEMRKRIEKKLEEARRDQRQLLMFMGSESGRQKRIEEELEKARREQNLRLKMEEVICKRFSNNLTEIHPYKGAIFSYLKDNGKFDLIGEPSKLASFIWSYYRVLSGKDVSLDEYISLQSSSRTFENEITAVLESKYERAKSILVSIAGERCIEQGKSTLNNDTINDMIDSILKDFKNGNLEGKDFSPIYKKYKNASDEVKRKVCQILGINSLEEIKFLDDPLTNAIKIMLYIESNTDLNLKPYLRKDVMVRKLI